MIKGGVAMVAMTTLTRTARLGTGAGEEDLPPGTFQTAPARLVTGGEGWWGRCWKGGRSDSLVCRASL